MCLKCFTHERVLSLPKLICDHTFGMYLKTKNSIKAESVVADNFVQTVQANLEQLFTLMHLAQFLKSLELHI